MYGDESLRRSNKGLENESVVRNASGEGDVGAETRSTVAETAMQAAGQGGNSLGTLEKQQSFSETLEGHRKSVWPL